MILWRRLPLSPKLSGSRAPAAHAVQALPPGSGAVPLRPDFRDRAVSGEARYERNRKGPSWPFPQVRGGNDQLRSVLSAAGRR